MRIDKIYIVHWNELKERKKYLDEQFSDYNPFWIEFYDRYTVSEELVNKVYKKDEFLWNNRVKSLYNTPPEYRDLRLSEVCNSLSHMYAVIDMLEHDINYGLVLEDDVILKNDFFDKFDKYFDKTPKDFDIIFLGSSFSIEILDNVGCENYKPEINVNPDIFVYEKFRNPKTRCVDAYIMTKSACEKLKIYSESFSLPYDFDLAYFIKELDLKVYWWEPGLVFQGSQVGYYSSSIR